MIAHRDDHCCPLMLDGRCARLELRSWNEILRRWKARRDLGDLEARAVAPEPVPALATVPPEGGSR